jgi:hypothetical protein
MKVFRAWTMVALCCVLGALTACSSSSNFVKPGYDFRSVGKVAVFVTINIGAPPQRQAVADLFARHVLQKNYDVMDRANLADLGGDAERSKLAARHVSAMIVADVHMPIGEHFYAKYGYPTEDEEVITLKARMWDVQTGALLWSGEGTGTLTTELAITDSAALGTSADSDMRKATVTVIGGIAAAPAGDADSAAALKPGMTDLLRSVIQKTCKGLPARPPSGHVAGPA